jgi:DNA repair photolyase
VKDIRRLPKNSIINISSSSDPYIPLEKDLMLTRKVIEKLIGSYTVEIVTKSDLVTRDIDLLNKGKSVVSITITTLNEELAETLEPKAPSPLKRVKAVAELSAKGVPVVVRLDPIIPFVTDNDKNIVEIVDAVADSGAKHIVSSTYKVKWDNFNRMVSRFPNLSKNFRELYFGFGEKIHGAYYAPKDYRERVLSKVREKVKGKGLTFSVCREGLPHLNDENVSCDGTSLVIGEGSDR